MEVASCIRSFSEQKGSEIKELNVQKDHVHLVVMVPPKISLSDYMGIKKVEQPSWMAKQPPAI